MNRVLNLLDLCLAQKVRGKNVSSGLPGRWLFWRNVRRV